MSLCTTPFRSTSPAGILGSSRSLAFSSSSARVGGVHPRRFRRVVDVKVIPRARAIQARQNDSSREQKEDAENRFAFSSWLPSPDDGEWSQPSRPEQQTSFVGRAASE